MKKIISNIFYTILCPPFHSKEELERFVSKEMTFEEASNIITRETKIFGPIRLILFVIAIIAIIYGKFILGV